MVARTEVDESDTPVTERVTSSSTRTARLTASEGTGVDLREEATVDLRDRPTIDLRDRSGAVEPCPALAVVIPTYERPDTLDRLLDALDRCSPVEGGVEVIVVDDGSTVDLGPVVARHPSVRLVEQANAGPAAARNRGWRSTSASIVAFTDDDTVPEPDWLVDLLSTFENEPEVGAVGGRIVALSPGRLTGFVQAEALVGHAVHSDGVRHLATANVAYRRSVLEHLDGFDERFRGASGEDSDLTLRAVAAGHRVTVIDRAVVAHDNRTTLAELLATYRKHGRTRHQVIACNPGADWSGRRAGVLHPAEWRDRYRGHRADGAGPLVAVSYLLLRAIGLLAASLGVVESAWARRRSGGR